MHVYCVLLSHYSLEIMESMALQQEGAFEKLYRWSQSQSLFFLLSSFSPALTIFIPRMKLAWVGGLSFFFFFFFFSSVFLFFCYSYYVSFNNDSVSLGDRSGR